MLADIHSVPLIGDISHFQSVGTRPLLLMNFNPVIDVVIDDAETKNKRYFLFTKIALVVAYILTLVAYFVVIISQNPKPYKLVGLMHTILIITSD